MYDKSLSLFRCCEKYRDYKQWRRERRQRFDVEAQRDGELTIYEKKGRRPTGRGFVRICGEDSVEMIDESYELKGIPRPPPLMEAPRAESLSRRELQHNQHVHERRKIIKKVSFEPVARRSFSEGIKYAQSVILGASEREKDERRLAEKRAVIKGHTAEFRRHSLVDQLTFAKSVIMDENVDHAHDKKMAENLKVRYINLVS